MEDEVTASVVGVLFGLEGFRLLTAVEVAGELELLVESTGDLVGCPGCGAVATAKDRRPVWVRDLPIAGRPVVLCWHKRVWCCPYELCEVRTWTEQHEAILPRMSLTERARRWAFEQVGTQDQAVEHIARELGVDWHTIMRIVTTMGTPVVDDPDRLADVAALGVDETAFLRAARTHPTLFATGITDLSLRGCPRLLEVTQGRSGTVLADWLSDRGQQWKQQICTASLDPFRGYATALRTHLPAATRVLDPFHVVKLGLSCMDDVRRRLQQEVTGHRGRRGDPLYGIRRVARRRVDRLSDTARERLRAGLEAGDPTGEVTAAWSIAQDLMGCYRQTDTAAARARADELITTARTCPIPEIARLGRTLAAWRSEFLASFEQRHVSNGPTENLNLKIKNTKRVARGFRNFAHYRLRLLLNHGRIHQNHLTTRIRTRRPSFAP